MRRPTGIRRKIWVVFVLQLAAISFATVLSVYGAATVLEDVLIKKALKQEAAHYWQRVARDPAAQLPDTANMRSFLRPRGGDGGRVPPRLRNMQPGYHPLTYQNEDDLVYVEDSASGRLYLIFRQQQVGRLVFLFGFVPLIVVLLIIYITTFLTYRASRRALSPVIGLANVVRRWDPKHPDLEALEPRNIAPDQDGDVEVLARALHDFATRIEAFVERERDFTRDASHELRSPLTVIKVAADVLAEETDLSDFGRRSARRIKRAGRDMEALIEAFLILARESDTGLPEEDFIVNEALAEEVERARDLVSGKPVELRFEEQGRFALHASPRVFRVLVGNLIRNACAYTDKGSVAVTVGKDFVRVTDTGIGMSEEEVGHAFQAFFRAGHSEQSGHGIGLSIVQRLSQRFHWPIELASEPGKGTTITVHFPQPQPV